MNSGSITSGFGSIDNGSSAITTTGTVTYGTLNDGTTSLTATAAEINAASDIDTRVENVTSTNSITAAETGKLFFLIQELNLNPLFLLLQRAWNTLL